MMPSWKFAAAIALTLPTVLGRTASAAEANRFVLPAKLQEKVNRAIDRGSAWLKKQLEEFNARLDKPAPDPKKANDADEDRFGDGLAALMGLALLESGVPAKDLVLEKTAASLRKRAPLLLETYSLTTAILFLDRLGDARDGPLIRSLALRLVAGQSNRGLWGYHCPPLTAKGEEQLLRFLEATKKLDPEAAEVLKRLPAMSFPMPDLTSIAPADLPRAVEVRTVPKLARGAGLLGHVLRHLAVVQGGVAPINIFEQALLSSDRYDLSNTQFALIGLWVARRHDLPLDPLLILAARSIRKLQQPQGQWIYNTTALPCPSSATCGALLALGVERALVAKPKAVADDPILMKGLRYLGGTIQGPPAKDRTLGGTIIYADARGDLYYFWSLERVAMAYDLEGIDGKNWYPWAAEKIVGAQKDDGRWVDGFGGSVDTSFALLVLRRTNLLKDLTASIKSSVSSLDQPAKPTVDLSTTKPADDPLKTPSDGPKREDPIPKPSDSKRKDDGPTVEVSPRKPTDSKRKDGRPIEVEEVEPDESLPNPEPVSEELDEAQAKTPAGPGVPFWLLLSFSGVLVMVGLVMLLIWWGRGKPADAPPLVQPSAPPAPIHPAPAAGCHCAGCGQAVRLPATMAGKTFRCPWCGTVQSVGR
jgi:hypothetical protein